MAPKAWKKTEQGNGVLFLFEKEKEVYSFRELAVSDLLEEKHLFPLVTEFINEHLVKEKTNLDIVGNGTKYLAKAIMPVWTEDKKMEAQNLLTNTRYHQNKINYFHGSWKSTFLDFQPLVSLNWKANLVKVYFCHKNDTIKPMIAIYADSTLFKNWSNVMILEKGICLILKQLFSLILQKKKYYCCNYMILIQMPNATFFHSFKRWNKRKNIVLQQKYPNGIGRKIMDNLRFHPQSDCVTIQVMTNLN
jgi:hypothetical protein